MGLENGNIEEDEILDSVETEKLEFSIGEKVVYPRQGVVEIVNIVDKNIGGKIIKFYEMIALDSARKILVAVNLAKKAGLKAVFGPEEVKSLWDLLDRPLQMDSSRWADERYERSRRKLESNDPVKMIEVCREYYYLIKTPPHKVSFRCKNLFDIAKATLAKQFALAMEISEEESLQKMEEILAKNLF